MSEAKNEILASDNDADDLGSGSINPWLRLLCGLVGVAGLGAGSVAVFHRDVEAGPVAMMLIGAVFLLIALRGEWPSRLKAGDNEAEWVRRQTKKAQETLQRVVETAPADQRPQIVNQISNDPAIPDEVKAPTLAAFMYESSVLGSVDNLVKANLEFGLHMTVHRTFDGVLWAADGRGVALEVKRGDPNQLARNRLRIRQQFIHFVQESGKDIVGALLITEAPFENLTPFVVDGRQILLESVVARETDDAWKIVQAAQRMLGLEVAEPS